MTDQGFLTLDVDECSLNTTRCHELAECVNNEGSFTCECMTGYEGDGVEICDGMFF